MTLSAQAAAKINLGLHVLRRRPDGYHDIETVLHRIDWADTVTAEPADTLSLTCSDAELPTDDKNLCIRAAKRLASTFDVTDGAALHLEKRVPYGAGLGGGSSDAATTLRLLSQLWDLTPTPEQLREIGQTIGADVPFFLRKAPAAYATGRGDALASLSEDGEYQLSFSVLVAVPPVEISTPWAYRQVTPRADNRPNLQSLVLSNDLARWRSGLVNDFEAPLLEAEPAVASVRDAMERVGADYVSLTGSGGAVYGVFDDQEVARGARAEMSASQVRLHLMHTPD